MVEIFHLFTIRICRIPGVCFFNPFDVDATLWQFGFEMLPLPARKPLFWNYADAFNIKTAALSVTQKPWWNHQLIIDHFKAPFSRFCFTFWALPRYLSVLFFFFFPCMSVCHYVLEIWPWITKKHRLSCLQNSFQLNCVVFIILRDVLWIYFNFIFLFFPPIIFFPEVDFHVSVPGKRGLTLTLFPTNWKFRRIRSCLSLFSLSFKHTRIDTARGQTSCPVKLRHFQLSGVDRLTIDNLVKEGVVYPTVDDNHFKSAINGWENGDEDTTTAWTWVLSFIFIYFLFKCFKQPLSV